MNTTANKALIESVFAALARGDTRPSATPA